MFQKFDQLFFSLCTKFILKRVKKSKFKKHKYHIQQDWEQFELTLLISVVMFDFVLNLYHHNIIFGSIMLILWSTLIFLRIRSLFRLKELIEAYDWFWENRKNPEIYNIIKKMQEESFEEDKRWRLKFVKGYMIASMFIISMQFISSPSFIILWMIFSYPATILTLYIKYVFDFDPPEEKKKESDAKLTNLMQQQLDKLFKEFAPKPI